MPWPQVSIYTFELRCQSVTFYIIHYPQHWPGLTKLGLSQKINDGFKYPVGWKLPLVVATCTNFSHILDTFLTFKTIYCTAKFPAILDSFYLVLTVSGELQYGWVAGDGGRQDSDFKMWKTKAYGCIRPSSGLKPGWN